MAVRTLPLMEEEDALLAECQGVESVERAPGWAEGASDGGLSRRDYLKLKRAIEKDPVKFDQQISAIPIADYSFETLETGSTWHGLWAPTHPTQIHPD